MGKLTTRRPIVRFDANGARRTIDTVSVEEPLEIRIGGEPTVVTMRTPGHDVELAHGWMHSEGFIASRDDVRTARFCEGDVTAPDPTSDTIADAGLPGGAAASYNIINVSLSPDRAAALALDSARRHNFLANSSCGVCGTQSIDELMRQGRFDCHADAVTRPITDVWAAAEEMQQRQQIFPKTGTVHAAALVAPNGQLLVLREDVGRHNAVDKVLGWALLNDRLPLFGHLLVVSSRASFEIVQKAQLAGVATVATVSGATSLAIDAADRAGLTLLGFVRPGRGSVFTHPHRITDAPGISRAAAHVEES